jgi:hypothetical protein
LSTTARPPLQLSVSLKLARIVASDTTNLAL